MSEAVIMMNVEIGHEDYIVEKLCSVVGCKKITKVFGAYDIIFEIEAKTQDELSKSIYQIKKFDYVRSTLTLMVITGTEK